MRRVLFSTISLLALTATAVVAADIPRPVARAPVYVPLAYNWTGFYLGINGGYGWGRSNWNSYGSGNFNTSGPLIGATIGYNWQAPGSPWVFGLEGDVDWTNMRGSFANALCPTGCETRNTWLATVRPRLGYAVDRVLPYVTGGLAVGDIRANQVGFAGSSSVGSGRPRDRVRRPSGRR